GGASRRAGCGPRSCRSPGRTAACRRRLPRTHRARASVRAPAWRPSLAAAEDRDAGYRARTAHVVREPELGVLHLPRPRLVPELRHALVDHADAARPDGVAEGLETAARVHGDVPVERRSPLFHQPAPLPLRTEAEVFDVRDLCPGKAVVHLGEVEVTPDHAAP